MTNYLSECFDDEITSASFSFPKGTPVYMRDGYTLEQCSWMDNTFIMITPKDSSARLPMLKKHYHQIAERIGMPCAMNLEWLTPMQRKSLIRDKIPFVSDGNQIYLPFWGCVFQEKYKRQKTLPPKMTPTTQLVFLWTYYATLKKQKVNLSTVVAELGVPKTSVSRAFLELVEYGLIEQIHDGTTKWIEFTGEMEDVISNAIIYLGSPVTKYIYMSEIPADTDYCLGGLRALHTLNTSERDGSVVLSKNTAKAFSSNYLIQKREFDDFGGVVAEVWKYDPRLLSFGENVDDISLLLSLWDNEDERVQKELDGIKKRYGLEV